MIERTELSYCAYGAKTILKHLERLSDEKENVRYRSAEDTEHLHRMRVATRRLRSTLPLFSSCFPQDDMKNWKREIKKLTRALGDARDADVQIDFLKKFMMELPERKYLPGIERLVLRIGQKRNTFQRSVEKAIDSFISRDIETSIIWRIREIMGKVRLQNTPGRSPLLFVTAREQIRDKVADVLSFDVFIHNPSNVEQLHELRKSNKKLRYTLEIFDPAYDGKLEDYLNSVKTIHTLLGEIHDCDVWISFLPDFIESEKELTVNYFGHSRSLGRIKKGIIFLLENRQTERKRLFKEFLTTWDKLAEDHFWENMQEALLKEKNE
jgi:CHAD domain-containing protein